MLLLGCIIIFPLPEPSLLHTQRLRPFPFSSCAVIPADCGNGGFVPVPPEPPAQRCAGAHTVFHSLLEWPPGAFRQEQTGIVLIFHRHQPKGTTQSSAFPTFLFEPEFWFVFSRRFYRQLWYSIDFLLKAIVFSQLNFYYNSDLFWFGLGTWQRLTQFIDHIRWIIYEKFPGSFRVKQTFRYNTLLQKKQHSGDFWTKTCNKFWLTRSTGNSVLPQLVLHAHSSHEPWHVQSIV